MPETKSAPETTTEELPVPAPEIEDEPVAEQKSAPPTQTDPTPVQPAQLEPKTAPESIANDNELADMVYVFPFLSFLLPLAAPVSLLPEASAVERSRRSFRSVWVFSRPFRSVATRRHTGQDRR